MHRLSISRRQFLSASAALAAGSLPALNGFVPARADAADPQTAQIAITLDLEMSRDYPKRGMGEWDYQKGNLDEATKRYAVEAARLVKRQGGRIHFFCVGRVLEQPDVAWLKEIAAEGHPVGNHTYDHVHMKVTTPEETQFRFQRSPWLVKGRTTAEVIRENIRLASLALAERVGIEAAGFRTPGGFSNGLADRPDLQEMLLELGFKWVSSKYPAHATGTPKQEPGEDVYASIVAAQKDAQPIVYPSGLVEVPMSPISDVGAFRTNWWKLDWFLEATRRSVTWAIENAAAYDFLAHPSCLVVEDPEFKTLQLICELVRESGGRARFADLSTIAAGA